VRHTFGDKDNLAGFGLSVVEKMFPEPIVHEAKSFCWSTLGLTYLDATRVKRIRVNRHNQKEFTII